MDIQFIENTAKKNKPTVDELGFGKLFTDYQFEMDYEDGKGWINSCIKPYSPITLDPAALTFHYGQTVFEGLKAYLSPRNEIIFFRPQMNIERMNRSHERMCIPQLDTDFMLEAITRLVKIEKEWIPKAPGTSLYIRPFVFATEPSLEVRASKRFKFLIILSPVASYYAEGFNPIKIFVEEHYVRAVPGGTGEAKTGGNYAASLKPQALAKQKGFAQILWLDGVERKYIEEVGAMNIFFVLNNEVLTPSLSGSILPGITRDSALTLIEDMGLKVTQRRITIDEVITAHSNGSLKEVFGTGTAAVISPVGELWYGNKQMKIADGKVGHLSQLLYDKLNQLQTGQATDEHNWTITIR